jgi:hypothetical protein
MPRPSMGRSARTVAVTVKVSQDEAQALRIAHGSPAKGLRALLDSSGTTPGRAATASPRPGGRCRIHRRWSEPTESLANGVKTIQKTCQDCGYVATTTRSA